MLVKLGLYKLPQIQLSMKKICVVIGARPQFIKHAPVELELKKHFNLISIHTGQHYDKKMSDVFFNELGITKPKYMLNVGSFSHGKQTALMLEKIEDVLLLEKPDAVMVYGDTNSTLAGALAANKINIPVIHIESGLRSYNKTMPEEINRILTDNLSSYLFAPTETAETNLKKEGITQSVFNVGDVMFDSLLLAKSVIGTNLEVKQQILATIHRPYNTDNCERLLDILFHLNSLEKKVVFPIHPRTSGILKSNGILLHEFGNIDFIDPVSYFDLIRLQMQSICIITDSGGVQKEAYMLKKKCITIRSETEWVETLENGWNNLVFEDLYKIKELINVIPGAHKEDLYGVGNSSGLISQILIDKI